MTTQKIAFAEVPATQLAIAKVSNGPDSRYVIVMLANDATPFLIGKSVREDAIKIAIPNLLAGTPTVMLAMLVLDAPYSGTAKGATVVDILQDTVTEIAPFSPNDPAFEEAIAAFSTAMRVSGYDTSSDSQGYTLH